MTQPTSSLESRPHTSDIPTTLEQLMQQKASLRQQIEAQKAVMVRISSEVAAPFTPAVHKGNSLLRAFNRGMAVFDGVMLGLKMMRQVKSIFGKKGRYRY